MKTQIYIPIMEAFGGIKENEVHIQDPQDTQDIMEAIDHLLTNTGDNTIEISGHEDPEACNLLIHMGGELFMTLVWHGEI